MLNKIECIYCGSSTLRGLISKASFPYTTYFENNTFSCGVTFHEDLCVYKCEECGMIFTLPNNYPKDE